MATIINADTSDGLKLTSDTSGEIQLQSAGTTAVTIDTSSNLKFNSGYGSVATAYGCRAWVNFNGTGTVAIRASGNVSSITDNGTGDYTVNFTTAMSDANYVAVGSSCSVASDYRVLVPNFNAAPTTSACRVRSSDKLTTSVDDSYVNVSIFR